MCDAAKLHVLDTLGCGLAADRLAVATHARETVTRAGGCAESSAIGIVERVPAESAAFANGTLCHGLDFDDTHAASSSHVSTVVCPAAIAAAEAAGASGRETLAAIIAGNEVVTRIGMAASTEFHQRGFHPTSVCGVFGATVVAARLLRLDIARATSALGLAGSFASGIFAYLADGTPTKPLHAGWAAQAGLQAARLAAAGASGPAAVLEAKFGLYHAFLGRQPGEVDIDEQLEDLGSRWETPNIAYKPYPACHAMHAVLGAASEASDGRKLTADDVAAIVAEVPEIAVDLVLEPLAAKRAPKNPYDAKFSLPYSVATLLVRGRLGLSDYEPAAIADPAVLELADKVTYVERAFATYPDSLPGAIELRLTNGENLTAELPHQEAGPGNPWSAEDVVAKFRANVGSGRTPESVSALAQAVRALDELPTLAPLGAVLRAT